MTVGILKFRYVVTYTRSLFAGGYEELIETAFQENADRFFPGEPARVSVKWELHGNRPAFRIDGSVGPGDMDLIEQSSMYFLAGCLVKLQQMGFELLDFTRKLTAFDGHKTDRDSYISQFAKRMKYI